MSLPGVHALHAPHFAYRERLFYLENVELIYLENVELIRLANARLYAGRTLYVEIACEGATR